LSPPATKAHVESLGIAASSITGALPAISGANLTGIETVTKTASNPLITTNGSLGDQWINTTTGELFILKDATAGSNFWKNQAGGSHIQPVKGLTASNYATGAQEVADTGGVSGVYYINNYTTLNTTQQVYCWIGVNGDNWQKFNPYFNHLGSNHSHAYRSCTGTIIDNFSATTANQAGDYDKGTGTSGCGGISTNTTGLFGDKGLSTYSEPFKIMATIKRHNTGGNFQVNMNLQAQNSSPGNYNDTGSLKTQFWNGGSTPNNERAMGIIEVSAWSGSAMTFNGFSWHGGDSMTPSDYVLNSSGSSSPTGYSQSFNGSTSAGSDKLYLVINAWADYAPDTRFDFTTWITT
jgi:hypothetical protein